MTEKEKFRDFVRLSLTYAKYMNDLADDVAAGKELPVMLTDQAPKIWEVLREKAELLGYSIDE